MHAAALYDFSPLVRLLIVGVLVACGPLLMVYLRKRRVSPLGRLHALALVTLFLTFDLVLFGAFTRLTDSGLGCPDWPGCYGNASPIGASVSIDAAQQAMPTGPVTPGKAWVEMVHRYLAAGVGFLIVVLAASAWLVRIAVWLGRQKASVLAWLRPLADWLQQGQAGMQLPSPWWATLTFVWVCVQGAFGALTVTMKLFPAIVSLHLLGGYVLLALLAAQADRMVHPTVVPVSERLPAGVRALVYGGLLLLLLQALSGAWVSTNYAVLVCSSFPSCQGNWWPQMDFGHGFEIWRPLGYGQDGAPISFQALTSIHFLHRLLAMLTLCVLGALAWYLSRFAALRAHARMLGALLALQLATGLSNVVLDWPLLAAVMHTGGAGAMVVVLTRLLVAASTPISTARSEPQPFGLRA